MQRVLQAISNLGFTPVEGTQTTVCEATRLVATDPTSLQIEVQEGSVVDLLLLRSEANNSKITIDLKSGSRVNLTELYLGGGESSVVVNQESGSMLSAISAMVGAPKSTYEINLLARDAQADLNTLQMSSSNDTNDLKINMRHLAAGCTSRSLSKCVAAGESNIEFHGLVYVAQDAQQSNAEQNCRSIELTDGAHIVAQPQLEIYADDVKCSHGATVGQMDSEAILYMRQRGLSLEQARKVQIEGFIADIVNHCSIEELKEVLCEVVGEKLEKL